MQHKGTGHSARVAQLTLNVISDVLLLSCLSCSTHVEILGNEPMLNDLLRIAAGQHQDIQDSILTKIEDIASKIPWDEL